MKIQINSDLLKKSGVVLLYKAIAEDLGHKLTSATVILDFGCGNGETVRQLRTYGFQAYGVDITLDQETEFLRSISKHSEYRIPFDDNTFDVIVSMSVLEHVKNLSKTVSEMWRVLKPGGMLFALFSAKIQAH
jgi:2-polyprenyl-3-methyl-5-hydroxy-6-metoxy-1,4-benzoquinol methylase